MWSDAVGALREPNFRLQFLAQTASVLGSQIAPIALAFAVLDVESSASALGFVLAARVVPNILLLPVGGVWGDRISRRAVMISSNLVQAAAQGVTAALLLAGDPQLWHLAAVQAVGGAATAFFLPASTGLTPQTVSAPRLQQANALLSLTRSSTGILGPAAGGVLVVTVGSAWAIGLDALTFVVSAAFLSRLRLRDEPRPERRAFVAELAEGWSELRTRTWVWVSILGFMAFQLLYLATFFVIGPVVAKESLGGASAWALILTALGLGSVAGDVIAMRFRPRRPLFAGQIGILLLAPLPLLLLGQQAPAAAIAAAGVLAGAALAVADTLWFTVLQTHVPPHAISRVSSYDYMGSIVLRPVGYAIVGPIVALVGVEATLTGAALGVVLLGLATIAVPSIRAVGRAKADDDVLEVAVATEA